MEMSLRDEITGTTYVYDAMNQLIAEYGTSVGGRYWDEACERG